MSKQPGHTFIWKATKLDGQQETDVIRSTSRFAAQKQLKQNGFFKPALKQVPAHKITTVLEPRDLQNILNSLILLLKSGLTFSETLTMLQQENSSEVQVFIYSQLLRSLQKGKTLADSFADLTPLFPPFFLSIIEISELSDNLNEGLTSAAEFYAEKESRSRELKQITRYPKLVFGASILLVLAVTIVIIPMFQNIYLLFGNDLPLPTRLLLAISAFIHGNSLLLGSIIAVTIPGFLFSSVRRFNPVLFCFAKIKRYLESLDDPYLFALAMKMQLENGQPLMIATRNAAACMSKKNQIVAKAIAERLNAGLSLTASFQGLSLFPSIFPQMLATTEKAGQLIVGFKQIRIYLQQKRAEQFARWNKFLEPALMIAVGALVLLILLAIYLPVFDLGNRVG